MAMASRAVLLSRLSPLPSSAASRLLLRPLAAASTLLPASASPIPAAPRGAAVRCLATQRATSSLRDSSPNWSNRPPKETILLDGCDFEHWLVVMEPPPGEASNPDVPREQIIDSYIKTLAQVVGSEEEARQKIYSVSTRHYFAFGALVSEELSYKLKELPKVRWVLPDSYLDVKNKDYGGEPFINGEALPYDPKYHEEWVRNNARANERSRRNDRPRDFDRSRHFEKRGVNRKSFPLPPGQSPGHMPPTHTAGGPPNYQPHMPNPQAGYTPGAAPPMSNPQVGYTPGGAPHMPNPQAGYTPDGAPSYPQSGPPGYQGGPPGYQGGNQGYPGGAPSYPQGGPPGGPPGYQGGNQGYPGGAPSYPQGGPPDGPPGYQGGNQGYQGGNMPGGNPSYQGGGYNGNAPSGYNNQH